MTKSSAPYRLIRYCGGCARDQAYYRSPFHTDPLRVAYECVKCKLLVFLDRKANNWA